MRPAGQKAPLTCPSEGNKNKNMEKFKLNPVLIICCFMLGLLLVSLRFISM